MRNGGQRQGFEGETVARRLRARRRELERVFNRTAAASKLSPGGELPDGLQAAVTEFIDYTIECIASGDEASLPVPPAAIARVQRAAQDGVGLDRILIELIAGHALLNEFVVGAANDLSDEGLHQVLALQGSILVRLSSLLARAYKEELRRAEKSAERRLLGLVRRLLAGTPGNARELGYSLDGWHVGLVATGPRAMDAVRASAHLLGGALLAVSPESGVIWAWIGSHKRVPAERVQRAVEKGHGDPEAKFALGEPGRGVDGWRSSHFEARAALAVVTRTPETVTCFSSVALEAIALQTPDLAQSLHATYLAPLARRNRQGGNLRQTLRVYLGAGCNASSAAITLKVTRRTVENRLRAIEDELGQPLRDCSAELELALRLEALPGLEFRGSASL